MFFVTVQRIDLIHLFFCQLKAEEIQVFLNMIRIGGTRDHDDAALQIPPENHLRYGYAMVSAMDMIVSSPSSSAV